jgi:hypothetical protein
MNRREKSARGGASSGRAAVPEHLIQAAVRAALRVAARLDRVERFVAAREFKHPAFIDEMLDELGRRFGQFPSVGVPPAFDEPCEKGTDHVIWYAC